MTGALIVRSDAARLPLADASVDLIVTSPPYFSLRSYRDDGEHFDGQIGSEATPREFLEALWAVTAELWRVLKPSGSLFVNLGDKMAGSGGHNNAGISGPTATATVNGSGRQASRRSAPDRYNQDTGGLRAKSLMGLPWLYALGCIGAWPFPQGMAGPDRWILRAEIIWDKTNGMPESVQDRVRRSHEQWFHLVKQGDYFSAVDEIREPYHPATAKRYEYGYNARAHDLERPTVRTLLGGDTYGENPLGRLPGSVWTLPTEPLFIPAVVQERYNLPQHFAAFPTEWPRRLILGWSPNGICTACGEGRRPVTDRQVTFDKARDQEHAAEIAGRGAAREVMSGGTAKSTLNGRTDVKVLGYSCVCTPRTSHRGTRGDWKAGRAVIAEQTADDFSQPGRRVPRRPGGFGTKVPPPEVPQTEFHFDGWTPPPTRPAVVLDPFAGTGTVVGVARQLGRYGIGGDLSGDYCRLAYWRVTRSEHFFKVEERTNRERQGRLL